MALIELKDIHKEYRLGETRVPALSGIDLFIRQGEFVAVWGPSGSGKSTLCNLIGLLDVPTRGTVLLNGRDVAVMDDDRRSLLRNRSIGFIFQSFNLVPVLSALENVMLPLEIQGVKTAVARQKAKDRLESLGLGNLTGNRPHKLSGGQQQRVAIARALITHPDLVIADEPTANLDSVTARQIIELMLDINSAGKTTFLFSTHDQRLLDHVNRQILLQDGKIVRDQNCAASLNKSKEATCDLG